MLLKKLSFAFLMLLSTSICSMEKADDEKPGDEKLTEEVSFGKSQKVKKLKFYCAKQVLKDDLSECTLPEDLKRYLKYFDKHNELKKHKLAPVFSKYLISCFDYLSLGGLKELLNITDKANEISEQKSIMIQRMIPDVCRNVFCDNPVLTFIGNSAAAFPACFGANFYLKISSEMKKFYKAQNLENIDEEIRTKHTYLIAVLDVLESPALPFDAPCLKELVSLSKKNYAPALLRLGMIQISTFGMMYGISCVKELIKINAIDYATELIVFILCVTLDSGLFSHDIEFIQRRDFEACLINFIEIATNENNYISDYDQVLALIYHYLDNKIFAKKYAKKALKNNEDSFPLMMHKLLSDIYKNEFKIAKQEFYSNKIQELEYLKNN